MQSAIRQPAARRFFVGIVLAFAGLIWAQAWAAQATPPPVPPSLAMLWVGPKSNVYVQTIDGRALPQSAVEGQKEVLLNPGRHVVTGIVYAAGSAISYRSVADVEAGVRYAMRVKTSNYDVGVEIEPWRAGEATAGSPAPVPPKADTAKPPTPNDTSGAEATLHLGQAADVLTRKGAVKTGLTVLLLDNQSIATGFWSPKFPRDIRISPGKHVVKLEMKDSTGGQYRYGEALLWFVAAPGAYYQARYTLAADGYKVWIEDADGHRVGGLVGSDDEPH